MSITSCFCANQLVLLNLHNMAHLNWNPSSIASTTETTQIPATAKSLNQGMYVSDSQVSVFIHTLGLCELLIPLWRF